MEKTTIGMRQRCEAPRCDHVFVKRTEDHVYCCNACKCRANRHKEKVLKETIHSFFEAIKNNQDCLEHLYINPVYQKKGIEKDVLEGEGVILVCCSDIGKNPRSGRRILWSLCYGVESMDDVGTRYKLHYRPVNQIPQFKIRKHHV